MELKIKLESGWECTRLLGVGRVSYIVLGALDVGPVGTVPGWRTDIGQVGGNTAGMGCRRMSEGTQSKLHFQSQFC